MRPLAFRTISAVSNDDDDVDGYDDDSRRWLVAPPDFGSRRWNCKHKHRHARKSASGIGESVRGLCSHVAVGVSFCATLNATLTRCAVRGARARNMVMPCVRARDGNRYFAHQKWKRKARVQASKKLIYHRKVAHYTVIACIFPASAMRSVCGGWLAGMGGWAHSRVVGRHQTPEAKNMTATL